MAKIRLDKYLAEMGIGTRSEVKQHIKKGFIQVDGEMIKTPDYKVDTQTQEVCYQGTKISFAEVEYYMLNKPAGVISASEDNYQRTVIDLIETRQRKDLFPVGRLDKDTEGLLLITNDGDLAHNLLSPRKHVDKKYYAKIDGKVTLEDVKAFEEGVVIDEDFTALPAKLTILKSDEISEIEVIIEEGKFHQIKRMFLAVGKEVVYLKRLSMGNLVLDHNLEVGKYRKLTKLEIENLYNS